MMCCVVMLLVGLGLWGQVPPYDVIISGARVDGSGSPWSVAGIGIRDVLVNGKFVLRQDRVTAERPGRVLLGPSAER